MLGMRTLITYLALGFSAILSSHPTFANVSTNLDSLPAGLNADAVSSPSHLADWLLLGLITALAILLSKKLAAPPSENNKRHKVSRHFISAVEKSVLSESVVGIAYISREGTIERTNNRFCELLGYTRDELLSLHANKLSHPSLLRNERMLSYYSIHVTQNISKNRDGDNLIDKDGNIIPVVLSFAKNRGPKKDEHMLAVLKRDARLTMAAPHQAESPFTIQPDKKIIYRISSFHNLPIIRSSNSTHHEKQIEAATPINIDQTLQPTIENHTLPNGISLSHTLTLGEKEFPISSTDLNQLISDAIENAILSARLSRTSPRIHIRSQHNDRRYEIHISDNGSGIPLADLPLIFKNHANSTSNVSSLALSRLKSIVEKYDGGVEIETAPNQGTRVIIWLPEKTSDSTSEQKAA